MKKTGSLLCASNKTVMLLSKYQSVYGGNFIASLMFLEETLLSRKYHVVYVFPEGAQKRDWFKQLQLMGKTVETVSFKNGKKELVRTLGKLVDLYNVGIVHTHFTSVTMAARLSLRRPNVKIFAHIHSDFSAGKETYKTRITNCLMYRFLSAKVRFISVSEAFVPINPKKITWLPNGLAPRRFTAVHMSGEKRRELLKVQNDELLCEVFGWEPVVKGVDIAVNAVKRLNDAGEKAKLMIICGTAMTPEKMRLWVSEHTNCSGEEAYLLYVDPIEDVYSYHEAADVLLSTSRSEGFSYAILEMLSLGKNCVVSDIPGVAWSKAFPVVHSFQSENEESCAVAIRKVMQAQGENAEYVCGMVLEKYSIEKWAEGILKEYGIAEI